MKYDVICRCLRTIETENGENLRENVHRAFSARTNRFSDREHISPRRPARAVSEADETIILNCQYRDKNLSI